MVSTSGIAVGRTFIRPSQADRDFSARVKYAPVREALVGKRIVVVDDSLVRGTTSGNEAGYRGIVNSHELRSLFKQYPDIIAWMHGHNHTFEMVPSEGILFVSNGRIGGFIPGMDQGPVDQPHRYRTNGDDLIGAVERNA